MFEPAPPDDSTHDVSVWHVRAMLGMLTFLALVVVAALSIDSTQMDVEIVRVISLVAVSGLVAGCLGLARHRLSAHGSVSLLAWPCLSLATITVFSRISTEAAGLVLGIFVLTFLFIGVTQPLRRCWWLIGPAAICFWATLGFEAVTLLRVALGGVVWALVACWPAYLLQQVRDQRLQIAQAAALDPLTGVQNRMHLQEHLDHVGPESALLLIDLDYFKQYNDQHGHLAGDRLLREFAETLAEHSRAGDAVYRFGGEEFLVVLHNTPLEAAFDFAGRLAVEWSAHESRSTFSAGIAQADVEGLRSADASLYDAKRSGRARAVISTAVLPSQAPPTVLAG